MIRLIVTTNCYRQAKTSLKCQPLNKWIIMKVMLYADLLSAKNDMKDIEMAFCNKSSVFIE